MNHLLFSKIQIYILQLIGSSRKELNSLEILIARCLWLERNSRVFDKFTSMPSEVCCKIRAEFDQWKKAKLCGVLEEIE
jgi:hypothetical protein